jgi:solute carrier family 25 carnitine/acylcarnitine transporter 20/29
MFYCTVLYHILCGYELLKRKLSVDGSGEVGPLGMIFAGGMAGVFCWLVCWPQDVIKSRMQSDPR